MRVIKEEIIINRSQIITAVNKTRIRADQPAALSYCRPSHILFKILYSNGFVKAFRA